jgi:hypothetical protein
MAIDVGMNQSSFCFAAEKSLTSVSFLRHTRKFAAARDAPPVFEPY